MFAFDDPIDTALERTAFGALNIGHMEAAFDALAPVLRTAPFNLVVCSTISKASERIGQIEIERGEIRRVDRSALDPHAQPYQDFLDRIFYAMAGISDAEARGLEARLEHMQ